MALFNTMGESSSPLFLTADTAGGLDLGPLEYYYKKKEAADADLAKKLTAKPELPEFKADALPGQKDVLEAMYKKSMYDIKKGVQKYGGLWGIYANSEEGKRDIAGLNITQYNLEMGETNKKRFQGASASVTQEGKSNVRYLGPDGKPIYFKDKEGNIRSATNEDMLQMRSKDRAYDPNTGELLAMDFNYTRGDSKTVNNEMFALYEKAKSTSSENQGLSPQYDPNTGQYYYGSNVMQGYDAYNYITYVKQGYSSNKDQLNAAVGVLYNNLSQDAKDGILNEIYDGREGKRAVSVNMPVEGKDGKVSFKQERVDYEKFDTDAVYRQQVIDAYTIDRVTQGTKPFVQTSSSYSQTYDILGKAEGLGYGEDLGLTQMIMNRDIAPSAKTRGNRYALNPATNKYEIIEEEYEQYRGEAFSNAYYQFNQSFKNGNTRMQQTFGDTPMLIGGNVVNISQKTNPVITENGVVGISTKAPMVQNKDGTWRNITTTEQKNYEEVKAMKDRGQVLTPSQEKILKDYAPQLYMDVEVYLGQDEEASIYKVVDPESGDLVPVSEYSWYKPWEDYLSPGAEAGGIREEDDKFYATVSIPLNYFSGLEANTEGQYKGNIKEQRARIQEANEAYMQNINKSAGSAGSYQTTPNIK